VAGVAKSPGRTPCPAGGRWSPPRARGLLAKQGNPADAVQVRTRSGGGCDRAVPTPAGAAVM